MSSRMKPPKRKRHLRSRLVSPSRRLKARQDMYAFGVRCRGSGASGGVGPARGRDAAPGRRVEVERLRPQPALVEEGGEAVVVVQEADAAEAAGVAEAQLPAVVEVEDEVEVVRRRGSACLGDGELAGHAQVDQQ